MAGDLNKMNMLCLLCVSILFNLLNANKVLQPIKEGEDVGVVIVSGGNLYYYQYEELGKAIQEASPQRLWIQLSNNDLLYAANSVQSANETVLGQGVDALKEAGMPSDAPVVAYGHSYGGVMAIDEVAAYPELVSGLILIGVSPNRPWYFNSQGAATEKGPGDTFPIPTMVANGDLDGNVRVTQTMNTFKQVKNNVENGDGSYKLRYPHALLSGVNHLAYVTGNHSSDTDLYWIDAEVTDEESMRIVANTTVPFIVYHTSNDSDFVLKAQTELEQIYEDTDTFMKPLLTAFDSERDESGVSSPWAEHAQLIIADVDEELADDFIVNNTLVSKGDLRSLQPSIEYLDDATVIYTYTTLSGYPFCWLYQAACMLESRGKTSEAITDAITMEHVKANDPEVVCRDVNAAAFDWVWNELVPELQQERYLSRGITVQFLRDVYLATDAQWLAAELVFDYDGDMLNIQSQNFITDMDHPSYPGMHHCKLLSPARAIEFVYVDALYNNMYS